MQWVVPTFHPAFVMRGNRRYSGVLLHDMRRALALTQGWRPKWNDEGYILRPSVDTIRTVLRGMRGKRVASDIETNGGHSLRKDPMMMRCIGFFDGKQGICIPWLYRDGEMAEVLKPGRKRPVKVAVWKPFYNADARSRVRAEIQALYNDTSTHHVLQNGQYDRLCLRTQEGIEIPKYFDTILRHHVVASYLPHDLGFITSLYTDSEYYKATPDGAAWSSGSDDELWQYCIRDCKATWLAEEKLAEEVAERPENKRLYEFDYWTALQCERWKEVGVEVDLKALELYRKHYQGKVARALAAMRKCVAGLDDAVLNELSLLLGSADDEDALNPGSLPQLRAVFTAIGVPLTGLTSTGEASTAKEFLLEARKELLEQGAKKDDRRIAFLDYLFAWREAGKINGTYLNPDGVEAAYGGWRIHPTFNVHVTPTGRLSSSAPNFQNQPKEIRGMYAARPGHTLVAGDWDSLELRLAALQSGEPVWLKAFKNFDAGTGPKLHKVNCSAIFGIPLEKVDEGPLYRAAKTFAYAVLYGAGPGTVFDNVRKEMPDMVEAAFLKCYENFKAALPVLFGWQKDIIRFGTQNQYLDSPILKRREYFFEPCFGDDSPEASAMLNHPNQSGAADVVGLANRRIVEQLFPKYRAKLRKGEALEQLAQIHDELLFEVPERLAEAFAADFKCTAEQPPDRAHAKWHLPVAVKVEKRWAKLDEKALAE